MCHSPLYHSLNSHWQKKAQLQHWSKGLKSWNNNYPVSYTSSVLSLLVMSMAMVQQSEQQNLTTAYIFLDGM